MSLPDKTPKPALDYDLLDHSVEARQKSKREFAWVAACIIFGWSPLATAVGAFVIGASVLLFPGNIDSLRAVVLPVVFVIGFGMYAVALFGLPVLARYYRAGFWRGFAAVGIGVLHGAAWALLQNVAPLAIFASVMVDAIVVSACATVIWRRWFRELVVARLGLLGRFD